MRCAWVEEVFAAYGELHRHRWDVFSPHRKVGGLLWGEESSSSGLSMGIQVLWCPPF